MTSFYLLTIRVEGYCAPDWMSVLPEVKASDNTQHSQQADIHAPGPMDYYKSTNCIIKVCKKHTYLFPPQCLGGRLGFKLQRLLLDDSVGRRSSVGIVTRYGPNGRGVESRWRRDFPHPFRTAVGPTQYNGYRVSFPGVKRPGSGVDHPPHLMPRLKEE
jgi:hypothetical protein